MYDRVDHTRIHIVEMGCQMVRLLSAYIVGPSVFVNLTPAEVSLSQPGKGHFGAAPQCMIKTFYDGGGGGGGAGMVDEEGVAVKDA